MKRIIIKSMAVFLSALIALSLCSCEKKIESNVSVERFSNILQLLIDGKGLVFDNIESTEGITVVEKDGITEIDLFGTSMYDNVEITAIAEGKNNLTSFMLRYSCDPLSTEFKNCFDDFSADDFAYLLEKGWKMGTINQLSVYNTIYLFSNLVNACATHCYSPITEKEEFISQFAFYSSNLYFAVKENEQIYDGWKYKMYFDSYTFCFTGTFVVNEYKK